MRRRSIPDRNQLHVVSPSRNAIGTISPSLKVASRRRGPPTRHVDGDRRLTLVLGLAARVDDAKRLADDETASEHQAHADRSIAVNMKLKDASISAIEAAQVLADTCFCQSNEAVVLHRILGVIDELGDVICALHEVDRQPPSGPSLTILDPENASPAFRKVFVPVGRGSIFQTAPSPSGADKKSGGKALRAEDAEQFLAALIGWIRG